MIERSMEAMFLEEVVEKAVAILTAPLPMVTGSRERDRMERMDLAVKVLSGEIHPGDVTVPGASTDPVALAFASLSKILK